MVTLLCEAIANRRIVRFDYASKSRYVEPHLLGETTHGQVALFGWSEEEDKQQSGWRLFALKGIAGLEVMEETFPHPRPQYNPTGDKNLAKILCALPQVFRVP